MADILHVVSLLLLVYRIRQSKSCLGISCKTQEMYLIVFFSRYLDMFTHFHSLYNTFMKILFIGLTAYLIYLMRFSRYFKQSYDSKGDSFNYWLYLVPPCFLLSLIFTELYTITEILWSFSQFLESVSFVPQLEMLRKMKEVENMTSHFVFTLGAYRLLYLINWIVLIWEDEMVSYLSVFTGII